MSERVIQRFVNPDYSTWIDMCENFIEDDDEIKNTVGEIIERVRLGGDVELMKLCLELDSYNVYDSFLGLSPEDIIEAETKVSPEVLKAIETAAKNIEKFHRAQMPQTIEVETMEGIRCVQKPVPIRRIGIYIPGGTAPLFSTVLMLAIPAKIAGCSEIVLCTPAGKYGRVSPEIIYAAKFCGVDRFYKVGGAQAIAAMAYGTETIPRVDKIFGPGNKYVMTAKQMVSNYTAIDMPAGPSEVMVIADDKANPRFVAADLLSQAEHGRDSRIVLVCTSVEFSDKVIRELNSQEKLLPRRDITSESMSKSFIVVFDSDLDMIEFANLYAPEHLIIQTENPAWIANSITSAGSVFLGEYLSESAGDYASGTNHTLPTNGWAHCYSGVNIDSFMRKMTIQELSRSGLKKIGKTIVTMAEAEGLQAHANAVKVRLSKKDNLI